MNDEHEDILGENINREDEPGEGDEAEGDEHKKKKDLLDDDTESLSDLEDEELDDDEEPFDDVEKM